VSQPTSLEAFPRMALLEPPATALHSPLHSPGTRIGKLDSPIHKLQKQASVRRLSGRFNNQLPQLSDLAPVA